MTEEENAIMRSLNRSLEKAENRAIIWKALAIILFCLCVWFVLELRGCIPSDYGAGTDF